MKIIFFYDWSNNSGFMLWEPCDLNLAEQSFYSLYIDYKPMESRRDVDILLNKVLLPFLYYSISRRQKYEYDMCPIVWSSKGLKNYSFFIYVDFFNTYWGIIESWIFLIH